ncbi:MAG: GTP-binding protein [Muribaculaceae bacterium]|nr:GTP-binding protein [Muribaculaceae bacterium]
MSTLKTVPVLLLTGYLGSGKTTLLNHILNGSHGIKFAVIVNDLGEVNIDADLIQKGGIVGGDQGDDLVALQNGCICCTLKMDLVKQLMDLVNSGKFDYIVIEASGICEPAPIAQTICAIPQMLGPGAKGVPVLDCITTVVDALRLKDEFNCGTSLSRPGIDEEDIENLIIEQVEFCNIILLNKISEVTPEEAARIRTIIRALQPKAKIIDCDYCDVPLSTLLNTHLFDFEKVATSATWVQELEGHHDDDDDEADEEHEHHHHEHEHEGHEHHHHEHEHHHHHHHHGEGEAEEYGVQTMVYYRRPPFDLNKFDYMLDKQWPSNIIRAKGVCYFSYNPDMSLLFEPAGRQKNIKEAGYWYATAPKEELQQFLERDPNLRRDWDEEYGDRMVKIVIIGQNLDRKAIEATLDACLAQPSK